MAASQDYLAKLKELAQAKYTADVGVAEGEFRRKAGGRVSGTGPQTTYKSPAQVAVEGGTPQYGELDIAYERNREGLEGGLESRGLLRSGQAATSRGRMASDYQQSVLDYYNAMTQKKGALGAQLAFDLADLEAKYGNQTQAVAPVKSPGVSEGASPVAAPTPVASVNQPAAERSPEAAAAFMGFGQPETKAAATGVKATPLPTIAPGTTNPFIAAANMALGMPASAPPPPVRAATPPKPATPAKPTPPKPSPPPPPPKPAPKPAPVPVKKPTPVKSR